MNTLFGPVGFIILGAVGILWSVLPAWNIRGMVIGFFTYFTPRDGWYSVDSRSTKPRWARWVTGLVGAVIMVIGLATLGWAARVSAPATIVSVGSPVSDSCTIDYSYVYEGRTYQGTWGLAGGSAPTSAQCSIAPGTPAAVGAFTVSFVSSDPATSEVNQ